MKREIKFRAWDIDNNRMFHDCFSLVGHGCLEWVQLKRDSSNNLIWEQYTGLKDKNGVEIYEGDIVKCIPHENWIEHKNMYGVLEVYFNNTEAVFQYSNFVPMNWGGIKTYEVIGNIHENPELLK